MEPVVIEVVLEPETGRLGVSGPIQNRLLALGMLEAAKGIVLNAPQHEPSRLVSVTGAPAQMIARAAEGR